MSYDAIAESVEKLHDTNRELVDSVLGEMTKFKVTTLAKLRTYSGNAEQVTVTDSVRGGDFYLDATDNTSQDNDGTIIIGQKGGRWKRVFAGSTFVSWFGAKGDGRSDDTQAFKLAMLYAKQVKTDAGRSYVVGELDIPINTQLDLTNSILLRKEGAKYAVGIKEFHGSLINGEINGQGKWSSTTVAVIAAAGDVAVTVADASAFQAGMRIFVASSWVDGGIDTNEISFVSGSTINLRKPLRGNLEVGAKFLGDFPLVQVSGNNNYAGSVKDIFVRNCLVGVQSGANNEAGGNDFTNFNGITVEDYIGAGLVVAGNSAAETFGTLALNGGRTSISQFVGDGSKVRFSVPYFLAKKVYRWGTEPSVRVFVSGTQLPITAYTVDLATMEVVLTTAPVVAAPIRVVNYEYAAFGIIGQSIAPISPSSVERVAEGIVICNNVGMFFDNCELGFFSNLQVDTSGYANVLLYGCSNFHFRGTDSLFAPFAMIFDGNCNNCSVAAFATGLVPDSVEFVATANKKEIVVRDGAKNINIDYLSWASAGGYKYSVIPSSRPANNYGSLLTLTPEALAIGGAPSGRLMLYGSGGKNLQVSDDCAQLTFMGSGYKYLGVPDQNSTMRVQATGSGSRVELAGPNGVRLAVNQFGGVELPSLPTTAPAQSGAIWRDVANGNILKVTP